ncbi:DUF6273 domain-containing protein [Clostridium sp. WILCCON 0269]|uniref:DUF6273 domain-containing protein n=1 Tax=Candidatus Clostridium eludens TaxID=3381663 RepID=A0ABW8SMW8_9CLOT
MSQSISNLAVGDKIKLGNYQVESETEAPIVWVVADKNHDGYPSNSVTLVAEKIIDLRGLDAGEAGNADSNRVSGGNNRYRTSNLRQWLNSNGAADEWFTPQNLTDGTTDTNNHDAVPIDSNFYQATGYASKKGFLNCFSGSELSKILNTDLIVVKNTVTDGGGSEVITDKIFLLSTTEVGLADENGIAEGIVLSLFSTSSNRISTLTQQAFSNTKNGSGSKPSIVTNPWHWWVRTLVGGTSYVSRMVKENGSLDGTPAKVGEAGLRPALNIDNTVLVSDTLDSDGAYTLILPISQAINIDTKRTSIQSVDTPIDSKRVIGNSKAIMVDTRRIVNPVQIITADTKRQVFGTVTNKFDTLRNLKKLVTILIDTKRKVLPSQTINIDAIRKIKVIQTASIDTKRINQFIQNFRIDTKRIALFFNFTNKAIKKCDLQMDLMYAAANDPIKITQNDFGAVVFSIAITANGESVNLIGNSINIVIDNKNNVGICNIVDAINGVVEYKLTQKDTAILGVHQFALELITADSRVTTEKAKYTVIADLNS